MTTSMSVASWDPDEPRGVETLIQAADDALYRAKALGRDRVEACHSMPVTDVPAHEPTHGALRLASAECRG